MEAVAALGVAGNTVQFLDFSAKLCATTTEIYRAVDGASTSNAQSEALLKGFIESTDEVSSNLGQYRVALGTASRQASSRGEAQISSIIADCQAIADDLLKRFEALRASGKPGKWKSFVAGVQCMWKKQELENLQTRLVTNRQELEWRILLSLRESVSLLASRQKDQFRDLQSAVITKLTETIRDQVSTLPRWPQFMETTQQQLRTDSIAISTSRFKQPEKSALRRVDHNAYTFNTDPDSFIDEYAADYAIKLAELEEQQWRSLWFPVIDDREDQIARAGLKTFDWILESPQAKQQKWSSFIDWLEKGCSIYWINGKAGSGKSTLMKYLNNHRSVEELLKSWTGDVPLVTASFFFWYNGNSLQKSQEGLLRSLLYQALKNHRELIPTVLSEATEVPILELSNFWTLPRLKCAFKRLLEQRDIPLRICLFVDGLDEYAGDHAEIAEIFRHVADLDHVKVCVSSRPLLVFDRTFRNFPGLLLQDLTFNDIQNYVKNKFHNDDGFRELEVEEPGLGPNLALQVVTKASGVFLWVKLVVHSLLEGIQNFDRGVDLERRLNDLPEDLDELYWHMLDRVKPTWYLEEGFRLLLLVHAAVVPLTLLQVALADRVGQTTATKAAAEDLSLERQNALCKSMAGRIKSRCLGLLEVTDMSFLDEKYRRVQFLHKSVKDFIETPKMMRRIRDCLQDCPSHMGDIMPELEIIQALSLELSTLKSRLRDNQVNKGGGLKRETWFDEARPTAYEIVRYARIAESKYHKSRDIYGPLITELNRMVSTLWESVNFRAPKEISGQVHWCIAPKKPGGARVLAEDAIDRILLAQSSEEYSQPRVADRKDEKPETTTEEFDTITMTSDKGSVIYTEDMTMFPITTDLQVRFAGLPEQQAFPGTEDEYDRPSRRWPTKNLWDSPFRPSEVESNASSTGFETFVRGLGLTEYADERYGRANKRQLDTCPEERHGHVRAFGKLPFQHTGPSQSVIYASDNNPQRRVEIAKLKKSLWKRLTTLRGRRG